MSDAKPATIPNGIKFLFGGSAGMFATCFVQPLDLVKNRMQVTKTAGGAKPSTLSVISGVIKNEGVSTLYTGLSAGLLRQATYTTTRQSRALSLVGIVEARLSLVESFIKLKYFHNVAAPALLCHKEPARRIQSPLLGALERKKYFACSSLVLYGVRDRWLPCMERSYYWSPYAIKN